MADHAKRKIAARRTVHQQFAVAVIYYSRTNKPPGGVPLTARLHNRLTVDKAVMTGYAGVIDADTRIVFWADDLTALGINPDKDDTVRFVEWGITVRLQTKATPGIGPGLVKWTVTQR